MRRNKITQLKFREIAGLLRDHSVANPSISIHTYPKCLPVLQLKSSGSKVHLISMVRQDAETVFQQIKELGMTGKGWVWIGTDGATSSTFSHQRDLERTMKGMIGTQPKNGEGSIYLKFLAAWLKKDSTTYPGIVHKNVCIYIPHTLHVSWRFTILLSEIECQLVKALQAAAISSYLISLTHPTMHEM